MPTLLLQLKNKILGEYSLREGSSLTIGRRVTNDVVIEDPAVSGHHAKIDTLQDRFVLIDLQSKNGSFVNEQLVNSHWLKHEDVITISEHSLTFHCPEKEKISKNDSDDFDETQAMNTKQHRRMMIRSNPTKSINVVRFWDRSQNRGKVRDVEPQFAEPRTAHSQPETMAVLEYLAGGLPRPKINGRPVKKAAILSNQDTIEIGSTRLQFSLHSV